MSWMQLPGGGSNPRRHRSREADDDDSYPPLPAPSLPPLRTLNSPRDHDSSGTISSLRPHSRHWNSTASRRADRIRSLDSGGGIVSALVDLNSNMDNQHWPPPTRRPSRLRGNENRPSNLDDLDRSLDEANTHLRALLDLTSQASLATQHLPQSFSQPLRPLDFPDDNRRNKRRKLDSERSGPTFNGFRYGQYGQVEPGQLRMEMVSCDGGLFSNESSHAAENILRDDKSVYCTKGNRCNIILRHQGGTVFTLQELVIKAPGSMNYSHPVQEGMVFVTMHQDDVLNRTAQYQIQYTRKSSRNRQCPMHRGQGDNDSPMFERRDGRRVVSIRHHDDGSTSTRARRSFIYRTADGDDDEHRRRTAQMPHEFAANLPDFCVTTECSGDEDEDGQLPRLARQLPPNRIGSLPFENTESDSDDIDSDNLYGDGFPTLDGLDADEAAPPRHHHTHGSGNHYHQDSHNDHALSLAEAWDAHANATQEAVRAVGGELLAPHARFFIEKRKSRCTIRFDPPVSGRFILLKMWSSQQDPAGNIDIQSVVARGFAGPRYFPSVQLC